jgi:pyridinium-3,5-bisthiocarboxylic acid mononucleotide nickel chelatase
MKTLYLDLFSGISGDMFIGAMLDLGVDFHQLEHALEGLKLEGYHLHARRGKKGEIDGVKFDVHLAHEHRHETDHEHYHDHVHEHDHSDDHHHGPEHVHEHEHSHGHQHAPHVHEGSRTFTEIQQLIAASTLSPWVKEKTEAIFRRIAIAEGKIHGLPPEEVHFHEVGAVDSIVDIAGACLALDMLGKPRVLASPITEGTGFIRCAHGQFPIPAPATLAILGARGIPLSQCDEPNELVTPTGAALLAELAESFGPMQNLTAGRIGYGLGTRDNKTRPNVLRAILSDSAMSATSHDWETDRVMVLETNLDDVSGEVLGHFVDQAFAAGALDVFHTPIQMKKNRPGVLLTVLCPAADEDRFSELILSETSAFGLRRSPAERRKLQRELVTVKTAAGEVTVKLGKLDGRIVQIAPEFESCRKLADSSGQSLKAIYEEAIRGIRRER